MKCTGRKRDGVGHDASDAYSSAMVEFQKPSRQCEHTARVPAAARRPGVTLMELLVVLTIMGIVLGYAALKIGDAADRTAVKAAAAEAITIFGAAREDAIMRRVPVAVLIDTASSKLALFSDGARTMARDLGAQYGVRLGASRDSMAYDARGSGIGAANLSLVLRRGKAAETVYVSRLGRVRH